jgi:hypothetical protein
LQPIFEEVHEVMLASIAKTTNTMKVFFILNTFLWFNEWNLPGKMPIGIIANSSGEGLERRRVQINKN